MSEERRWGVNVRTPGGRQLCSDRFYGAGDYTVADAEATDQRTQDGALTSDNRQ